MSICLQRSATVTARPSASSLPTAMPLSSRTTVTVASMTAELVRMAADAQRELAALDASLHVAAGASTDSLATAASTAAVGEDTGAEPAVPPTVRLRWDIDEGPRTRRLNDPRHGRHRSSSSSSLRLLKKTTSG